MVLAVVGKKTEFCAAVCHVMSTAGLLVQSTSSRTVSPSQHLYLPGFCCCWSDGLELSPEQSPRSRCYYRQLQVLVENVCPQHTSAISTLDLFRRCTVQIYIFRLDALALSVIATATWLGGWVGGCLSQPVLYQND